MIVLSAALLAEFGDVVGRPEFADRFASKDVTPSKLVVRLTERTQFVAPNPLALPPALRDPKDLPVLAAALAARADAIVTGDTDLLAMKAFEGIPIITVREALEKLGLPTK